MKTIKSFLAAALASLLLVPANEARAEYPEKPINMIIGFPAGGGTDLAGRVLAKELRDILGKPVVVVNRPGAASMIAADSVAKARPDGYTVWFGSAGTLVTREALGRSPVAFGEGLKIAGLTGHLVAALGVPVDSPFQSVQDIIDAAKATPGTLRWSHNGVGAAFMAMGQGFVTANKLDVVGVPFQGAANLRHALAASQTDFGVLNAGDRLRLGDDQFRILGVIAGQRDMVIDDSLPTLAELGIEFIEVPSPIGILVPGGVSDEIVNRLAAAIEEATQREGFVEGMANIFIPVTYMDAQASDAYVREVRANVDVLLPQLTP